MVKKEWGTVLDLKEKLIDRGQKILVKNHVEAMDQQVQSSNNIYRKKSNLVKVSMDHVKCCTDRFLNQI